MLLHLQGLFFRFENEVHLQLKQMSILQGGKKEKRVVCVMVSMVHWFVMMLLHFKRPVHLSRSSSVMTSPTIYSASMCAVYSVLV